MKFYANKAKKELDKKGHEVMSTLNPDKLKQIKHISSALRSTPQNPIHKLSKKTQ